MTVQVQSEAKPISLSRTSSEPGKSGANWFSAVPFLIVHLSPLMLFFVHFTIGDLLLAVSLYLARMFFITAGYHRFFSHRAFRLSRPAQLVMAIGGITAAQKGPLWWAGHHRRHHQAPDTPRDVHSPDDGMWWSHVGWILSNKYKATDLDAVQDLAAYPELVLVNRLQALGPWLMGVLCFIFAGWGGLLAFALSTIAVWHATFAVNSIAHRFGRRRYETRDKSRNLWPLAVLTLGEGWHNNHHHYPPSARQGHRWWEVDCTWYALKLLSVVGLAKDLRTVPVKALESRPAKVS